MGRASWIRLVALAGIWGSSFLLIKVGLEGLSPAQVVVGRVSAGAAVLLVVVVGRRIRLPTSRRLWAHLLVLALVANVIPFFLFAWGEQRVSSGLAGVLNATTPLLTLVVAIAVLPEERASAGRMAGLLLGFAGVIVILGPWRGAGRSTFAGELACIAAAGCYGVAFTYTRRFVSGTAFTPLALAAGQLTAGTVVLALVSPVAAAAPTHLTAAVVLAVVVLGGLNTGVAYLLSYGLIRDVGATTASTVTYLIPVVAVALGVVVRNEPVTWNLFAGAAVVIAGVGLAEGRLFRSGTHADEAVAAAARRRR